MASNHIVGDTEDHKARKRTRHVNTIKCMMNTDGSRTSRMGRTYRICG